MLNALSSLSYSGKQFRKKLRIVNVNSICKDLAIYKTQCLTMAMSSTAQYILLGDETGLYLSSDSGATFPLISIITPFGATNYQSAISDNGNVILLYQCNHASGTIYLSTDKGVTFLSKQLAPTGLTISSVVMSLTGQYIVATGSGTAGGIYVSQNTGTTFTQRISSAVAQGCACSPNGRTIVVAASGAAPWVSYDYGSTFTTFGPTSTFYQGRRVFVHPDESSFAIRTISNDGFFSTNVSLANAGLTTTTYNESALYADIPSDKDGYAAIDQHGRMYFVSNQTLYYLDSTLTVKTAVPNLNGVTFADSRICVSYDGKYILGYTGTTLRLVQQFTESNTVTITSSTFDSSGTVTLAFSLTTPSRPAWVTWTPKTGTSQPINVTAGITSVSFSGNFVLGTPYNFTISARTADGLFITGKSVSNSTTFTVPNATFVYTPMVFNQMLVFATSQTISPSSCYVNNTSYTISSESETLNGTALKWGYVNFKNDPLFSVNSSYSVSILFSNSTGYVGTITDDVKNSEVCLDETTFTDVNSIKSWSSKVKSYSITLSAACSKVTSTANTNNTTLAFDNIKISGSNIILTQALNGNIGSTWSFFCVAQNTGTNGHLLANDTVTATTSNFYTLGVWQAISNSMWWYSNWFSTSSSNTTRAVNWNVFSFFRDTNNSNAGTYYVNRNNTNLVTNSLVTNNPNWPNYNLGHDIQVVPTLSAINGTTVNIAFLCLYKSNKTNAHARCIEYCLFKQYGIISRY